MSDEIQDSGKKHPPASKAQSPFKVKGKYDMRKAGKILEMQRAQSHSDGNDQPRNEADDLIERELAEALGGMSEADIFANETAPVRKKDQAPTGGVKTGKVYRIHDRDIFIDLPGSRTQGVLSSLQFPEGVPEIGTEVEVKIEGFDGPNGVLILSRKGAAVSNANWDTVAVGMIVEARITAINKGGLEVDVHGLRGFMPVSQIEMFRVNELEPYLNQKLQCIVTEVDKADQNLLVSRRDLLEREREEAREKLWAELKEGQVREGVVRSVQAFGAFVDLGGADGLLHVSEMSYQRVNDATKVFQTGQLVRVIILRIDAETRKIALGFKQLQENPWNTFATDNPPGSVMTGKVTKLAEFGAFVELAPGVEGLIHLSELAPTRVRRPNDVVKVGQEVTVKLLSVDPATQRISLSLKAMSQVDAPEPEPETQEPAKPAKPPKPRTTPLRGGTSGGETKPLF